MRKIILSVVAFTLMIFSVGALAEKIIVTGKPAPIKIENGVYVLADPSASVNLTSGYYYLIVDNTHKVCYVTPQPGLAKLKVVDLTMMIANTKQQLYCYDTDPEYFIIGQHITS